MIIGINEKVLNVVDEKKTPHLFNSHTLLDMFRILSQGMTFLSNCILKRDNLIFYFKSITSGP